MQFFSVKIKIRRLPVVNQNGALFMFILSAAHVLSQYVVVLLRKRAQSAAGKTHNNLRRHQLFILLQQIVKTFGMNSHLHTHLIFLVFLRCAYKISAIGKAESVAVSLFLVCVMVAENKSRVILVAGRTANTADFNLGMLYGNALRRALKGMSACKINYIRVKKQHIHVHGQQLFHKNAAGTLVDDFCRSCNHVFFFVYAVIEFEHDVRCRFTHCNNQRFAFCDTCVIKCGHTVNFVGAVNNFKAVIPEFRGAASVVVQKRYHAVTVIADTKTGNLLRKRIERVCAVLSCTGGISRKTHIA